MKCVEEQVVADTQHYVNAYRTIDNLVGNLFPSKKLKEVEWQLGVHKAPCCGRPIVDYGEYVYVQETGKCAVCEDRETEFMKDMQYEKYMNEGVEVEEDE